MTVLWVVSDCVEDTRPQRKCWAIVMLILLFVALYLAYKDGARVRTDSARFGLFLLALFYPDIYIAGHLVAGGLEEAGAAEFEAWGRGELPRARD
jgi:cbb3-type cytochrome oxidase subunit 3